MMMRRMLIVTVMLVQVHAFAQTQPVTATQRGQAVNVTADHPDWNYVPGEKVVFTISAPPGTNIAYTIGPEMMPAVAVRSSPSG